MTREQKIKLIELIQEYFEATCEEDIKMYGYTIPKFEMFEMFSLALFNKNATVACGFNKTVHKYIYTKNLTEEETAKINDEFKNLVENTDAFSLTKSRRAVRVSEKVVSYNNILY